jgi:hypothetical protein
VRGGGAVALDEGELALQLDAFREALCEPCADLGSLG